MLSKAGRFMMAWPDSILGVMFIATFLGVAYGSLSPRARTGVALGLRWFGNITLLGLASLIAWLLPS
jgi:hypothetical protein